MLKSIWIQGAFESTSKGTSAPFRNLSLDDCSSWDQGKQPHTRNLALVGHMRLIYIGHLLAANPDKEVYRLVANPSKSFKILHEDSKQSKQASIKQASTKQVSPGGRKNVSIQYCFSICSKLQTTSKRQALNQSALGPWRASWSWTILLWWPSLEAIDNS